MRMAALFVIAKTWKQPRYPLVVDWINKLCYIQTKEYYSAQKNRQQKKLSSHRRDTEES